MNKEIEKEFDKRFVRSDGLMDKYVNAHDFEKIQSTAEAIKSFIDTHFIAKKDAEEAIDEHIKKWDNEFSASRKECLQDLKDKLL
jgi:hypothetical protein